MKRVSRVGSVLKYLLLAAVMSVTLSLMWLYWDSGRPKDDWFSERHGQLETVAAEESRTKHGQSSQSVLLTSDSGLRVSLRVIRSTQANAQRPVLIILGGHRTGSDAVELFGDVVNRSIVAVDYPYHGPESVKGAIPIAKSIPLMRQAILDTTPAVSLILDWLVKQAWVDNKNIIVVGASLGVPFAAAAASRDSRITALVLVHGAADNRLWLQAQVARRIDTQILHYPLSTVLYWLAYGPVLDAGNHIATVSPRPLLIIGARDDERTPAGQTELLFDSAGEPKRLRFTDGQHVQPNRPEIVAELMRIVDEEISFLVR